MNTYIYKSSKKDELYIYLAEKDNFSNVPQDLYNAMGKEPIFVMELELTPERPLAREDVNVVMKNLAKQGFHVQIPPQTLNITTNFNEPAKYVN